VGIADTLRNTIMGAVPGDAARKVSGAMAKANGTLGTTSGLDAAMQSHADDVHPVDRPAVDPSELRRGADGSVIFPK
jgi:hypothetical protein